MRMGMGIYVKNSLEAVELYKEAFGLSLGYHVMHPDGGTVETPIGPLPWSPCAFSLTDKFGVWWYVSAPQHYPGEDFDPAAASMG